METQRVTAKSLIGMTGLVRLNMISGESKVSQIEFSDEVNDRIKCWKLNSLLKRIVNSLDLNDLEEVHFEYIDVSCLKSVTSLSGVYSLKDLVR